MKKNIILFILALTLPILSCNKFDPDDYSLEVNVNDFVWKAMNAYYLWQDKVPDLADSRFNTEKDLFDYLDNYNDPKVFFEGLKYQPDLIDKWSWITEDYVALNAYFSGARKTSGAKIQLHLTAENSNQVYGYIRYILPDSNASETPLERGDVFNSVNGQLLTKSNAFDLVYNIDTFTLDLGTYSYNYATHSVEITPNGEHITLTNGTYTENPIHVKTVFEEDGHKIGYLMYNSFTHDFNAELNNAFQFFKSENVTDLILDLRYNGGGSVQTCKYLSSMITGQFNGEIFTKEEWNPKNQEWIEANHPDWLVNYFTNTIEGGPSLNSLNLDHLVVITTGDSASASELVINALNPYIDVVTIGTKTHGKYVASVTLYDSDDFMKEGANPDHLYAIQPIVLKEVNKLGDYSTTGFEPTIYLKEDLNYIGFLGEKTEPLTERAITYILTGNKSSNKKANVGLNERTKLKGIDTFEDEMYIDKEIPLNRF